MRYDLPKLLHEHMPPRAVLVDNVVRMSLLRYGGVSRFRMWSSIDRESILGSEPELLDTISLNWRNCCEEIYRYTTWLRNHAEGNNRPVWDAPLRHAICWLLNDAGCVTIGDVLQRLSNGTLTRIHGIGRKREQEIRTALYG